MLSINDINTARVVSQAGSIRAAAQQLFKSQPAISQSIKRLEDKIGFALFDRSGYRVTLTPKGKDFLLQTESLMATESRLREYAEVLEKGQESTIQIVVWPMISDQVFIPTLRAISQQYPETSLDIDFAESIGAIDILIAGGAEIAIAPYAQAQQPYNAIDTQTIDRVSLVNVISPKLLGQYDPEHIPREQLSQWNRLLLRSSVTGKSITFGAEKGGRRWTVNDQRTMTLLIQHGLGWGLIPEPAVREQLAQGELIELNLPDFGHHITVDIVAARPQGKPLGPVASAFWEELVSQGNRHLSIMSR